jgi:hypothetical protein
MQDVKDFFSDSPPQSKPKNEKPGLFSKIAAPGGLAKVEAEILGPDYSYSKRILSPAQIGMSGYGSFTTLGNDIAGLMGYVDLMVTGNCKFGRCASTIGRPLGNKFFLETPVECADKNGKLQTRSIYVNNVPDGSLPFITDSIDGMGVRLDDFTGLLPGVLSNLSQISPMQMLSAFTTTGKVPNCQSITMETIDSNDFRTFGQGYVLNREIARMNPKWFPGNIKPAIPPEGFCNRLEPAAEPSTSLNSADYSKMPDDLWIKFYYSSLGLLGIYIFMKMMLKKKLK